ncbi:hypothetical protein GNX71_11725 [Variovorax sp. RKNM96]|uniref:SMI1/KNR4 family protein n=1 Tax=Variovorax sp. RKNM96 TaxID=2681552 RepID=UPI001980D291|nr:SMI1/KNR4 family protein [Variovorax sp. RKNM96]QSI30216.1 hypothetical protein GNX71_11725 [Variovorax sp. RKNM96]
MTTSIPPHVIALLEQGERSGPAPEELISSVERRHGLSFPPEYRAFLLQYGASLMPGHEIFGLVAAVVDDEAPTWSDIRPLLQQLPSGVAAGWVPISDDGMDLQFYLSCAIDATRGSVFVLGPGADGRCVASDFFAFVEEFAGRGIRTLLERAQQAD